MVERFVEDRDHVVFIVAEPGDSESNEMRRGGLGGLWTGGWVWQTCWFTPRGGSKRGARVAGEDGDQATEP